MGLLDMFRGKKSAEKADDKYSDILPKAMKVFCSSDCDAQTELIEITGGSLEIAEQLYWFFPSILFRLIFPEVNYVDGHKYKVIYNNGKERVFSYSNNELYQAIKVYMESNAQTLNQQQRMNILSHSAELDAVNNALNAGSKLENLVLVPSVFLSNLEI